MNLPPPGPAAADRIPTPPKTVARMQSRRRRERFSEDGAPQRQRRPSIDRGSLMHADPRGNSIRQSVAELLAPPAVPIMPEDPTEDPVRYAQCIRLLWLAASMKAFDVVVVLLDSDEANVAMCEIIGDMVPMLQFTRRRDPSPPQVVVALADADADRLEFEFITPTPLLIPRNVALPSLVCEILHPTAHWSASLADEEPAEWRTSSAAPLKSMDARGSRGGDDGRTGGGGLGQRQSKESMGSSGSDLSSRDSPRLSPSMPSKPPPAHWRHSSSPRFPTSNAIAAETSKCSTPVSGTRRSAVEHMMTPQFASPRRSSMLPDLTDGRANSVDDTLDGVQTRWSNSRRAAVCVSAASATEML